MAEAHGMNATRTLAIESGNIRSVRLSGLNLLSKTANNVETAINDASGVAVSTKGLTGDVGNTGAKGLQGNPGPITLINNKTGSAVVITAGDLDAVPIDRYASEAQTGILELATSAEVIAGVDAIRGISPLRLASLIGSSSADGLVELATYLEVQQRSTLAGLVVSPVHLADNFGVPYAQAFGESANDTSLVPASTSQRTTITFPVGRFTYPPVVIASAKSSTSSNVNCTVEDITATGCTVRRNNPIANPTALGYVWHAVQMYSYGAS